MTLDERIVQINANLRPKPLSQKRLDQMARDLTHVMCAHDRYRGNPNGFLIVVDSSAHLFEDNVAEDDYSENSFP